MPKRLRALKHVSRASVVRLKGQARLMMNIDGRNVTVTFSPHEDDLVRLTVEVPDNKLLHRYVTWPGRPKSDPMLRRACKLSHIRLWYVYCGTISPTAITEVMKP